MEVSFRDVCDEDEEFLFELYAATRAEEMAMVAWSDEQRDLFLRGQFNGQSDHYRKQYPKASFQIIVVDGRPAGRLYAARLEDQIRIIDLTLLAAERGQGIGTPIVRRIMDEATGAAKPVTIYVESFNPSRRLFDRLGFSPVEDNQIYVLMRWQPV